MSGREWVLRAAVIGVLTSLGAAVSGSVGLDTHTFDKIVDGTRDVLVKFDKQYPYGDAEDAFKAFAPKLAGSDVLVADVAVTDYGDKENSDLSDRFSIAESDFPAYRLFRKGAPTSEAVPFTSSISADALVRFVRQEK